jgi:hypothetical protein
MTGRNRSSFLLALAIVSLVVSWLVFSQLAVPPLIKSAYRGESLPIFNDMIAGQALYPVEHYLATWDGVAWRTLFILFPMAGLIFLILNNSAPQFGGRGIEGQVLWHRVDLWGEYGDCPSEAVLPYLQRRTADVMGADCGSVRLALLVDCRSDNNMRSGLPASVIQPHSTLDCRARNVLNNGWHPLTNGPDFYAVSDLQPLLGTMASRCSSARCLAAE